MKTIFATATAIALVLSSSCFALETGTTATPPADVPAAAAPAAPAATLSTAPETPAAVTPPPASKPAADATPKCTLISISVPAIPNDQPATFTVAVKDSTPELAADLTACNPKASVATFIKKDDGSVSTNSAAIKVTQGLDQKAYFKIPTERAPRLLVSLFIKLPTWKGDRYWTSGGPVGDKTELVLSKEDEAKAGKVF